MERKKFHDPLIDLQRQMNKLVYGKHVSKFKDVYDAASGTWSFVQNRYEKGSRVYQMQVDFMYLIKAVRDSGRHSSDVRKTQAFITACATELLAAR